MRIFYLLIFLFPFFAASQTILVLGKDLPLKSDAFDVRFVFSDSIHREANNAIDFNQYLAIFIFSTANSEISESEEKALVDYLKKGGNIYLGAENSPFYAESNQLLKNMFNLQFYGNFETDTLKIDPSSNFTCERSTKFSSGNSTVSFPVDYRFKVEAWSMDNPIILSSKVEKGRLILDGGYSRFYQLEQHVEILDNILQYFFKEE